MTKEINADLRQNVDLFLRDFRDLIERHLCVIYRHQKTEQTLKRYGITYLQCEDIIYGLRVEDYYDGPKCDEQHPGIYWEFGIDLSSNPIYIKLKIASNDRGDDRAVCYSFHDAEFQLNYPLRSS